MTQVQLLSAWFGAGALAASVEVWKVRSFAEQMERLPEDRRWLAFPVAIAIAFVTGPLALPFVGLALLRQQRNDRTDEENEEQEREDSAARAWFVSETAGRLLAGDEFTIDEAIDSAERLCAALERRGHAPWIYGSHDTGVMDSGVLHWPPRICERCGDRSGPVAPIGRIDEAKKRPLWLCIECSEADS